MDKRTRCGPIKSATKKKKKPDIKISEPRTKRTFLSTDKGPMVVLAVRIIIIIIIIKFSCKYTVHVVAVAVSFARSRHT